MARTTETLVTYTDDLTGKPIEGDAQQVTVIINGEGWTLDLSPESLERFETAVAKFVKDGAPVPMRVTKSAAHTATYPSGYLKAVREWARANGHEVYDRGIPAKVLIEGYEASLRA